MQLINIPPVKDFSGSTVFPRQLWLHPNVLRIASKMFLASWMQVVLCNYSPLWNKPLTTTASSAYTQPCNFRQPQCANNYLF